MTTMKETPLSPEPSLHQVHQDLVTRLDHDRRLRVVEQDQATTRAVLAELPRMEERLTTQIAALASKTPWPAVSSIVSVVAVVIAIVGTRLMSGG